MAEQVLMIALSPTMETGTISKWEKKEGDRVESGEVLCQVETDKATMDYEAIQEGVLLKILVNEGEQAGIGFPIAIIGEEGEDITELLSSIKVGADRQGQLEDDNGDNRERSDFQKEKVYDHTDFPKGDRIIASPLARRMAEQRGLDLASVKGSGPRGRIIKRDILSYAEQVASTPSSVNVKPTATDEIFPVTAKRAIIAQRLAESKFSAPHYYLRLKVRTDDFMKARKSLNQSIEKGVSVNAFLIKFVAETIKRHPIINSTWQKDTILRHGSIDIGLAVAQNDGLITPMVRDCGNKGIIEIENELKDLINKALNNKLTPEEYSGATFTISNLGSFGIEEFTAIINPPGSAILAVGKMERQPVVNNDNNIEIQTLMTMTLSCDHRVIDGAVGAAFLKDLKDIIENPIRALY
ncbi:MAG: pyruvate dehydrogenase complex dihydrolipoamide acetyltransferase [Caldicoprobacterales bacterium]|jgi:pyruvate dehydrogenase E2 component (dihydrolipoamide acetyltransferase)|nr:pyruvate dehydrogenase complex dihydrolipoamide acetyltransferase [Clostridiales bacterium]